MSQEQNIDKLINENQTLKIRLFDAGEHIGILEGQLNEAHATLGQIVGLLGLQASEQGEVAFLDIIKAVGELVAEEAPELEPLDTEAGE